jgi:phage terminase small subunit
MRGRKPVPLALHQLRGFPGHRTKADCAQRADEPMPPLLTDLTPPAWLDSEAKAKAEWARMAPLLVQVGVCCVTSSVSFATTR